jgi:phosphohistidine phosphatase
VKVFFLRHGEAGRRITIPSKDFERSLTASGVAEIEEIAESMKDMDIEFDKFASSPLARARETAEIVSKVYKQAGKLEMWDELKPEANRLDLYRRLSKMKQDADVLLVGHEPFMTTVISEIISGSLSAKISLKKAGLARVQIDSFTPKASGELRWLLTPKQIKNMG